MGQALNEIAPLWHQLDPEPFPPLQAVASFNFPLKSLVCPFQTLLPCQVSSHCNPACARGRFGRKTILQLSLACSMVFGMLSAASVSYTMLAITRTLTGVALSGISLIVLPLGECGGLVAARGTPGRQWLGRDLSARQGRVSRNRSLEIAACAVSLQNIPLARFQELQFAVSLVNILTVYSKHNNHLLVLLLQQETPFLLSTISNTIKATFQSICPFLLMQTSHLSSTHSQDNSAALPSPQHERMVCHLQGVSTSPDLSLLTVFLSCQCVFYNEKEEITQS